ncbi:MULTISPECIES: hypothetical protein [unclassified Streptomyces]|uniref:hypothetical protein n=1 Tax=unclassified Streptomyces TaxID=2593676 RepID=UPI0024A7BF32|nr:MULTISPECIES: hypothetical protein [unclassified Streptomyces]
MTIDRPTEDLGAAYADALALDDELAWLRACTSDPGFEPSREFLLRQAALLDRLALQGAVMPLVLAALGAADRLVVHDIEHRGLSLRGRDLFASDDHQAYVREEYHAWLRTQTH